MFLIPVFLFATIAVALGTAFVTHGYILGAVLVAYGCALALVPGLFWLVAPLTPAATVREDRIWTRGAIAGVGLAAALAITSTAIVLFI
jgi:hypothetical protein